MLVYILVIIFMAIALFTFFTILACISCCGLTHYAKNMLQILNLSSYDKMYSDRSSPINSQCFICIETVKNQVVATCNHSYCAECIITYIRTCPEGPILCPACRKTIYVLFRKFQISNEASKNYKKAICSYNSKYSQQPSFFRSITQFTHIISHIPILLSSEGIKYLLTNQRTRYLILMAIYTLSPVDLLPQILLGPIGLIDDAAVSLNILRCFSGLLIDFIRTDARRNQ